MSPGTSADGSRAERRRRLQELAGLTVHGSDGKTVGRVRDVYVHDATGELAAITVMPRQLSARSVLIPAAAIADLPDVLEPPGSAGDPGPATDADPVTGAAPPADPGPAADPRSAASAGSATDPASTSGSGSSSDPVATTSPGPAADSTSEHAHDHALHLLVDTATAKAGVRPPDTLHTTPQDLREAAAALHLEEGSARA